jgi:hypothetical protein
MQPHREYRAGLELNFQLMNRKYQRQNPFKLG